MRSQQVFRHTHSFVQCDLKGRMAIKCEKIFARLRFDRGRSKKHLTRREATGRSAHESHSQNSCNPQSRKTLWCRWSIKLHYLQVCLVLKKSQVWGESRVRVCPPIQIDFHLHHFLDSTRIQSLRPLHSDSPLQLLYWSVSLFCPETRPTSLQGQRTEPTPQRPTCLLPKATSLPIAVFGLRTWGLWPEFRRTKEFRLKERGRKVFVMWREES